MYIITSSQFLNMKTNKQLMPKNLDDIVQKKQPRKLIPGCRSNIPTKQTNVYNMINALIIRKA